MSTFKSLLRACMVSAACLTASVVVAPQAVIGAAQAQEIQDMVLGAEDAPVTVVEYASFTCPHCANFHDGVFQDIKRDYIDTGKVKFVFREVYFDRYGLWASMVARCGGEMRYFGITDMIFDKQREWTASGDPATIVESLRGIGRTAGLSDEQLDVCLSDGDGAQALVTWYETNQKADDVQGTPTFRIDGEKYDNMAFAEFARILDEKLGE